MALDVYKDWLGIPDGPRPPDHYQLLRLVKFEDDADKIRGHYRKLNAHVRKYASGQYSVQSQKLLNELAKVMLCLTDPERKRDYDESLGREFAESEDRLGQVPIEDVLRKRKILTPEQIKEAQTFAGARGLSIRDAVVQMKLVDAERAAQALAESLRLTYVDLAETLPDDSVLDNLPRKLVRRYSLIPLFVDDGMVLVACIDDPPPNLMEELQLRYEMPARAVIATPLAINQAISKYYAPGMRDEVEQKTDGKSSGSGKATKQKKQGPPPGPRKRMSQLSSGEQAHRRQVGLLIIAWSTIAAVLVDYFLFRPLLFPHSTLWFASTYIALPASLLFVFKSYWK